MASTESGNISININKELIEEIDRFLKENPRFKSRNGLIKHILHSWLDEQNRYMELKKMVRKELKK